MIKSTTRDTKRQRKKYREHSFFPRHFHFNFFFIQFLCVSLEAIQRSEAQKTDWTAPRPSFCSRSDGKKEISCCSVPRQRVLLLIQSISATRIRFKISCTNKTELDIKKFWNYSPPLHCAKIYWRFLSDLEPDSRKLLSADFVSFVSSMHLLKKSWSIYGEASIKVFEAVVLYWIRSFLDFLWNILDVMTSQGW